MGNIYKSITGQRYVGKPYNDSSLQFAKGGGVHVGHATNGFRPVNSGYTQHDTMMNTFHKQSQRSGDVYNPATRKVSQAPSGGLLGSDLFGGQKPYIGY